MKNTWATNICNYSINRVTTVVNKMYNPQKIQDVGQFTSRHM